MICAMFMSDLLVELNSIEMIITVFFTLNLLMTVFRKIQLITDFFCLNFTD